MHQAGLSSFVYYLFEGHRVYRRIRDSVHPLSSGGEKEDDQRDPLISCSTYPPPGFYLESGGITYNNGLTILTKCRQVKACVTIKGIVFNSATCYTLFKL